MFFKDCVSFNHPSLGCTKEVIKKFFHKVSVYISITESYLVAVSQDVSHDIFAEVDMLLDLPQFQHIVPDTLAMHLERGYLILYGCIIVLVHNILLKLKLFSPHPLKEKVDKPVVMLPLILLTDDISGNKSKKWHKFDSWYMSLVGLPHHLSARQENMLLRCSVCFGTKSVSVQTCTGYKF